MLSLVAKSIYKKFKNKKNGTKILMRTIPEDLKVGKGCLLGKRTHIAENVEIGNFSYVNSNTLDTFIESNTQIGSFCSIAPGVIIGMGNHDYKRCTTHPILFDSYYIKSMRWNDVKLKVSGLQDVEVITKIGSDVWIGVRANIKRGVQIGNGAVIAAEAVVTKDVPEYAIVAGAPAKVIGYRFDEDSIAFLKKNEQYCFWNWDLNTIKSKIYCLYDLENYKRTIEIMRDGGCHEKGCSSSNNDM